MGQEEEFSKDQFLKMMRRNVKRSRDHIEQARKLLVKVRVEGLSEEGKERRVNNLITISILDGISRTAEKLIDHGEEGTAGELISYIEKEEDIWEIPKTLH